jgi:hypothetical protein
MENANIHIQENGNEGGFYGQDNVISLRKEFHAFITIYQNRLTSVENGILEATRETYNVCIFCIGKNQIKDSFYLVSENIFINHSSHW